MSKRNLPDNSKAAGRRNLLKFGSKYRFKKGQSGNPGGRPKLCELSKASREILGMEYAAGITYAQQIAWKLAQLAVKGHVGAASELADRAEGRPRQALEFSDGADPLTEILAEMTKESARIGPPVQDDEEETIN